MFGHQDDHQDNNPAIPSDSIDAVVASDVSTGYQQPYAPNNDGQAPVSGDNAAYGAPAPDQSAPSYPPAPSAPPPITTYSSDASGSDVNADAANASSDDDMPAVSTANSDDLLDIKKQALEQLSPLVDHLEQSPEEKFRTTMMMIQANDNQELIKSAYEAAQQIGDEKTKAQALLDIVNEINYFTHQNGSNS